MRNIFGYQLNQTYTKFDGDRFVENDYSQDLTESMLISEAKINQNIVRIQKYAQSYNKIIYILLIISMVGIGLIYYTIPWSLFEGYFRHNWPLYALTLSALAGLFYYLLTIPKRRKIIEHSLEYENVKEITNKINDHIINTMAIPKDALMLDLVGSTYYYNEKLKEDVAKQYLLLTTYAYVVDHFLYLPVQFKTYKIDLNNVVEIKRSFQLVTLNDLYMNFASYKAKQQFLKVNEVSLTKELGYQFYPYAILIKDNEEVYEILIPPYLLNRVKVLFNLSKPDKESI